MRGNRSTFRPCLEMLETREVPSAALPLATGSSASAAALQSSLTSATSYLTSLSGKPMTGQESLALQIFGTYPTNPGTMTGFLLAALTPADALQAANLHKEVNTLQFDQSTLTNDINNGATAQQIAVDYTAAGSTYGQIKNTATQIENTANADKQIIMFAQQSGMLNPTDAMQATYALNQINRAAQNAVNNLNAATAIADTTEPFNFPTIAFGA
jgi:hypothetical protein